ncbi:MAG: TonB-dependent receptor [Bacteroidales bacterium]
MKRELKLLLMVLLLGSQYIFAQTREITGIVTDDNNQPLVGVTVVIEGTTIGSVTNIDGRFVINATTGDRLRFSFVGMEPLVVEVTAGISEITIRMKQETTSLDEIVFVGYGSQKKESVVGAITQATGDQIKMNFQGSNLTDNLNGLMPGVVTIRESGVPGGAPSHNASGKDDKASSIYVRGQTTWNGGQPLILVDGVERSMMDVDPNEIENISVLKDASATAVFGVRGADGVILITTKRGTVGKPVLSFESIVTASSLSEVPDVLNSYDVNYLKNLAISHGLPADETSWKAYVPWDLLQHYKTQEYPELYPDVNWRDEMSNDYGWEQRYNLNVKGGTEFVRYFLSLGYLNQGDILNFSDRGQGYDPSFSYERYNFRSNFDFDISKTTRFKINLSGIYGIKDTPGYNDRGGIWNGFYGNPPDMYPVKYSDGTYATSALFDRFDNQVYNGNFHGLDRNNRAQANTDFELIQKLDFITKGLSAKVKTSFDNYFYTSGPDVVDNGMITKYIHPSILDAQNAADSANAIEITYPTTPSHGFNYVDEPNQLGAEQMASNVYRHLYYEASLNYVREFGNHYITGLFLFNRETSAMGSSFPSFREGWVGRATYDYDSRYFLEFNGAYNGSEKFDREYRFGFFPSFAGGWMVSNERFFEEAFPFVNTLKLRYSWGTVGNDANIARWQYLSSWDKTNIVNYFGSPVTQPGYPLYREGTVANPNIHWEVAEKQDIGMEVGIFKNLLSMNFDYYWEHRTDMFINASDRANNAIFGSDPPSANLGELKSHGWEFELNFSKARPDSRLWAKFNLSQMNNEVIERDDPELKPDYQKQAGFSLGQQRTQVSSGIIQTWDEMYNGVTLLDNTYYLPGDYRLIDYNADGVINEDDAVPYMHSIIPEYSYGFSLGYNYKGFGVMTQFYGVTNVSGTSAIYNEFRYNYSIAYDFQLNDSWAPELGRTTGENLYPHVRYNQYSPKGHYYVWDYSYFKLQTAELSYTFSGANLKSAGVNNLRLYLNTGNILIWNKTLEDRDRPASDNLQYPLLKRYSFGINLTF